MITPEDAEVLLRQMIEASLAALDATDAGDQLSDEQYSAIRLDLHEAIGDVLAKRLRIGS